MRDTNAPFTNSVGGLPQLSAGTPEQNTAVALELHEVSQALLFFNLLLYSRW